MHVFLCVNTIVCLIWVRNYHNCLWKCLPTRQHRLCWEPDFLFFHTSFEKEVKPFKIFQQCSLLHGPVACDAIYYSVILLSGRGWEFVLCSQRPPVPWQWLEMLKRQYPWNDDSSHVWSFFATGFPADWGWYQWRWGLLSWTWYNSRICEGV